MKKTIENVAKVTGIFALCAIASANWGFVSGAFNLVGGAVRGAGNISLMILGGKPAGNAQPAYYSGNIGDDGSGDDAEPLANYRDNN